MMASTSMSSGFREMQKMKMANEDEEMQIMQERERQVLRPCISRFSNMPEITADPMFRCTTCDAFAALDATFGWGQQQAELDSRVRMRELALRQAKAAVRREAAEHALLGEIVLAPSVTRPRKVMEGVREQQPRCAEAVTQTQCQRR